MNTDTAERREKGKKYMLKINLQLFAEGGEGSEGTAAAVGTETAQGVTENPTPAGSETVPSSPEEDRKAAFAKFKADYKSEYDAEVQSIIQDRLKKVSRENANLSKNIQSFNPLVEMLGQKYGIDGSNPEAILKALEEDDSYYESEAAERGLSVEQLKQFKRVERENRELRRAEEERERNRQLQETFREWDRQADELKKVYPEFNMAGEITNPEFAKLLNAGVPVRTAYETAHLGDIMRGAMQFTAQKATEKVANAVAANAARPSENGLSSQAAAVTKLDINSLTAEQMDELKRRAARGERVEFSNS